MSVEPSIKKSELRIILNKECAKMPWSDLQRFFASGNAVHIDESLDLIDAAAEFALDNKTVIKPWVDADLLGSVSDELAQRWWDDEASVWAVVVAPWVFVQGLKDE